MRRDLAALFVEIKVILVGGVSQKYNPTVAYEILKL